MHLPLPPWWWFYGRRYHCLCQHWVVFNYLLSLDNYPTAKIYQTLVCRACRFQPSSTSLGILQFVCFFSAPGNGSFLPFHINSNTFRLWLYNATKSFFFYPFVFNHKNLRCISKPFLKCKTGELCGETGLPCDTSRREWVDSCIALLSGMNTTLYHYFKHS